MQRERYSTVPLRARRGLVGEMLPPACRPGSDLLCEGNMRRYFCVIRFKSRDGSFVADRYDDVGKVFIPQTQAALAGDLLVGDHVILSIEPGGVGRDVMLSRRGVRHLPVQAAE